jgi:outer membrane autotransporter protein
MSITRTKKPVETQRTSPCPAWPLRHRVRRRVLLRHRGHRRPQWLRPRRTALEGTVSGRTVGGDLNGLVAGGYDWKNGGLSIGPTASFQYTFVGFGDFTESGSLAPLSYPAQNADSLPTAFGMKASYDWKIGPIHLIPEVRAAWQHEFGDTDYSLISSFASGAGNSFTVNGPAIGHDSMLLGAGFAIHSNDRISTYAYYDGELFRTNYRTTSLRAFE